MPVATKPAPTAPVYPESAYVRKYGIKWPPIRLGKQLMRLPDYEIERLILKNYDAYVESGLAERFMSWTEHFQAFVTLIWGRPECTYKFTWNPYATRMLEEARKNKLLGISGHASSGKSQFGAIWGIANFLISPTDTKVLVTSTSLQESRMRIWGVIEKYWEEARKYLEHPSMPMPGKLVSSSGKIVGMVNGKSDDLVGLTLVAGGNGNDKDASTKIGFKAGKLILVADELPLLTHKLYDSVTNLLSNANFQMIGTGNLTSILDPFGLFVEPEQGWASISETVFGWKTRVGGYCVRFDGEESPNVLAAREIYPGILTIESLREIRQRFGERSPGYYRMIKSFPCPTGNIEAVYNEVEIMKNGAMRGTGLTAWYEKPVPLAFLDPSFSKGGDRAAAAFGLLGYARHPVTGERRHILELVTTVDLMLKVNARDPNKDRNEQLAELFIAECVARGVSVADRGADVTGGGDPFSTVLAMKMGQGMCKVSFAGVASDKRISANNKKTGKERFCNRVTELWYISKDFIAAGQIRGLDNTTVMEMCSRTFKDIKDRVLIETKDQMKERTNGRSPDFADAFMGLVEVARDRHGFLPAAVALNVPKAFGPQSSPLESALNDMWSTGAERKPGYHEVMALSSFGGGWDD